MRIIFTGGGTGGHVMPNIAVIEELRSLALEKALSTSLSENFDTHVPDSTLRSKFSCRLVSNAFSKARKIKYRFEILYVGSKDGVEKKLIEKIGVNFKSVCCGKWRRYFSVKNLWDIFKVPVGIFQARKILMEFKPDVIFSKGGFVSVPVVIAAKLLHIPVILHESDLVPGLANKICARYASKICVSFEESRVYFAKYGKKSVFTGNPVRKSILKGVAEAGYKFTGLSKHRPVILVIGGSQGARQINELISESANELLKKFQIVHVRGRGNLDISLHKKGYVQYEFLDEQLKDIYAMSSLVISRGGANSLAEIAAVDKMALIIPLGMSASRGDQIDNTKIFVRNFGWGMLSGDIKKEDFVKAVEMIFKNKINVVKNFKNGVEEILKIILSFDKSSNPVGSTRF